MSAIEIKSYIDNAIKFEINNGYNEAISILQEAIFKYPNFAILHNNLGCSYANIKEYNLAKDEFIKAINLTTENRKNNIITPDSYPIDPINNLKKLEKLINA